MKTLDEGHVYKLKGLSGYEQTLTFLKRSTAKVQYTREWPGLLCQEVLRALIARVLFLKKQEPCTETDDILHHLRQALFLFEVRAYRRKANAVNRKGGKHDDSERPRPWRELPYADVPFGPDKIETYPTGEDGHIVID